MQRRWKLLAVSATVVVAGSMAVTSLAAGSTEATKVRVRLAHGGPAGLTLTVTPGVVKAGPVTFVVSNQTNIKKKVYGVVPATEAMGFVLLKTNLAPDQLPTTKNGRLAEEKGRVGKAVGVEPGTTATITLDVKPGKYVAISNAPWGYTYGAYTALTVTG